MLVDRDATCPPIPDQRYYTKANFFTLRNETGSRSDSKRPSGLNDTHSRLMAANESSISPPALKEILGSRSPML